MINILVDHNMEGQSVWLWDTLVKIELPDIIDIRMLMFADVDLPEDSNDRVVWRFAQGNNMMLLTDNRSDNEENSLEQTIREENNYDSLPVLTIAIDFQKNNYTTHLSN